MTMSVTLKAIARAAGVDEGCVYRAYASKPQTHEVRERIEVAVRELGADPLPEYVPTGHWQHVGGIASANPTIMRRSFTAIADDPDYRAYIASCGGQCTTEEVATYFGCSRQRASQIELAALAKLRKLAPQLREWLAYIEERECNTSRRTG